MRTDVADTDAGNEHQDIVLSQTVEECEKWAEQPQSRSADAVTMFPTPTACEWKGRGPNSKQQGLAEIVKMYPTPTARDYKDTGENRQPLPQRETEWAVGSSCKTPNLRNWEFEPDVGRVAYGISNRVDRLKCLGNAVVPQQAFSILRYIAAIERGGTQCLTL